MKRIEEVTKGKMLLAWCAFDQDHNYARQAVEMIRKTTWIRNVLADGLMVGVLFCNSGFTADVPGLFVVERGPDDRLGNSAQSKWHKISIPLLFPDANGSIYMDCDITPCESFSAFSDAWNLACKFGWVATSHPRHTVMEEPLQLAQNHELGQVPLMDCMPMAMNGVVIRSHKHEQALALTREWLREFDRYPGRDQPALVRAIHRTGYMPLLLNENFMRMYSDRPNALFKHPAPGGGFYKFAHASELKEN